MTLKGSEAGSEYKVILTLGYKGETEERIYVLDISPSEAKELLESVIRNGIARFQTVSGSSMVAFASALKFIGITTTAGGKKLAEEKYPEEGEIKEEFKLKRRKSTSVIPDPKASQEETMV